MVEIKTYIIKDHSIFGTPEMIDQEPEKYFIELSTLDSTHDKESRAQIFGSLEGAIVLSNFGHRIMSFRHWDSLEELWTYLLIILDNAHKKGEHKMTFPGQPISIGMKIGAGNMVQFLFDGKYWNFEKGEFISCFLDAADEFFSKMEELGHDETYPRKIIEKYKSATIG
jgi:hypothetical protein